MDSQHKKEELPDHLQLLEITDRYLVDLECLREMYASVMPVLKEQDKKRNEAIRKRLERAKKIVATKNLENQRKEPELETEEEKKTEIIRPQSNEAEFQTSVEFLISNAKKIRRAESLFAKQSIVSFVSRFDEFLGSFLEIALAQNPEWLKSSEKTITYKDLISLKSIDSAIKGVISKEVEQLLRGSHEEQLTYIDDKLKLGIKEHFPNLVCFLEVTERRNLFVHTGGLVSAQYLDRCKSFRHSTKEVIEGNQLDVSEEYFNTAFSVFFEIGLRIGQAAFRRLFPNEIETADTALNKLAIKFLNYGDNELAEVITNYDLNIPQKLRSEDSENVYYARINRALAQKRLGRNFEPGLDGVPWKAFHTKYKLCLHVLRDEFKEAASLMYSDDILESVGEVGFRTWPIFKDFRCTTDFHYAYKVIFGHEYILDPEKDAPTIMKQEEVPNSE